MALFKSLSKHNSSSLVLGYRPLVMGQIPEITPTQALFASPHHTGKKSDKITIIAENKKQVNTTKKTFLFDDEPGHFRILNT